MKKGFTLIEIIVVIALLSAIGIGTSIAVIKVKEKKETDILLANENNFNTALEVYLETHSEVLNNINNKYEGAVITLETLKNEGLINSNLNIDYKDNYYIVSNALLSNKTNLETNVVKEECNNSIAINKVASWTKSYDSSSVLYFCPKNKTDIDDTIVDLETIACSDISYNKETLAYRIICNAKKNEYVIEKSDNNVICLTGNTDACEQLKESVETYFHNYTIYDENATKSSKRSDYMDEMITAYLSKKEDDGGYSYYYRDRPNDNYITFAGMCWQIYRIDGNGNIKLILHNKEKNCESKLGSKRSLGNGNYGYKFNNDGLELYVHDYLNPEEETELAMSNMYKKFQKDIEDKIKINYGNSKELSNYLVPGNWCIDNRYSNNINEEEAQLKRRENKVIYSIKTETGMNKNNISFKCPVDKTNKFSDGSNMYVAGVTYEEILLGGNVFALFGGERFWTLNISYTDYTGLYPKYYKFQEAFIVQATYSGHGTNYWVEFSSDRINKTYPVVPVIQLKAGTIIKEGNGTLENPYIIE